ncbi:phosphopentomutase [Gemmiger sp. An50]|uniref:phosphopentomutase n=1 Tax=Gemmiger sp. An50 TaxID=1965639 RepID=UPI000B380C77|nr:phosphopentomutase [Gemmiger sp. An50]OUN87410.1 phosphopentomutase [Gemmiger sp. An50]
MAKRVFLVVLDSFGVGAEPDADKFGDVGANTLASIAASKAFDTPNMKKMGLFNLDGVSCGEPAARVLGTCARLQEASNGKDTTIGHWEIAGVESERALPTYPNGFPKEVIEEFEKRTGRKVICNATYSGTEVLKDYGEEHMRTGALIVYTSADSVFQVAAHEEIVPVAQLYEYCQIARDMLKGEHGVGRVIARPFVGTCAADFQRTPRRHDYSLKPPKKTMLDALSAAGKAVIGVGKIYDIFDGEGVTETIRTSGNTEGIKVMLDLADRDFEGLAFINLVDFDMVYGHRRNIDGYAAAATEFDQGLGEMLKKLRPDDLFIITADHGCDPGFTKTTDHTREYVPMLAAGSSVKENNNLGTVLGFGAIGKTVCAYLGVEAELAGQDLSERMFV